MGLGRENRGKLHLIKSERAADARTHQTYGEGSTDLYQELQGNRKAGTSVPSRKKVG